MQIVIDIPDKIYKELTETAIIVTEVYPSTIERALTEGIVLPKGHGRLIDADDMELPPEELISRMIVAEAPTIVEADKEGADNGID